MSARDVTHFTINTTHFLAIANNFDGVTYRVDSQIFLFEHGALRLVSSERESMCVCERERERERERGREEARKRGRERGRARGRARGRERKRERKRERETERIFQIFLFAHGSLRLLTTSPQSGIKSHFSGPRFVLAFAGIRRLAVQSKAVEKDDLLPRCGPVAEKAQPLTRGRDAPV